MVLNGAYAARNGAEWQCRPKAGRSSRCASATGCFVKRSSEGWRRKAGYGKDENDKAVSIFPTTPATTTTGLIRFFLKTNRVSWTGRHVVVAAPLEPWR